MLRRSLVSMSPVEAMEQLIKTLQRFPTNKEFLAKVKISPLAAAAHGQP